MQNLTKKQKTRTPASFALSASLPIRTFRHHAYVKYVQHGDNSLNSCPNLDEAALRAMKRCIAP